MHAARVLFEKLINIQLVKEFLTFYGMYADPDESSLYHYNL